MTSSSGNDSDAPVPAADSEPRVSGQEPDAAEAAMAADTDSTPAERPKRVRRRPGRFRRWFLRPAVYLVVALVLLLALVTYLILSSDAARSRAARLIETQLTQLLDRDVTVGDIRWAIDPLAMAFQIEVENLVVPSPWPETPALASIPRVTVNLRVEEWRGWKRPVIDIDQVAVERPAVYLEFRDDGTNNLPIIQRRESSGESPIELRLGALSVRDGEFDLGGEVLPLDLDAKAIFARLTAYGDPANFGPFDDGGDSVEGLVSAQDVVITLRDRPSYPVGLTTHLRLWSDRLEVVGGRVSGPALSARFGGELSLPAEARSANVGLSVNGDFSLLERLALIEVPVGGQAPVTGGFRFDGELLWSDSNPPEDSWSLVGRAGSQRLVADGHVIREVEGVLSADSRRVRYELERARIAGGEAAGLVTVDIEQAPTMVQADLAIEGFRLFQVASEFDLPIEGISSVVAGDLSYRFAADEPLAGSGWANLFLDADRLGGGPAGPLLPLAGEAAVTIDDGLLSTEALRLLSVSQRQTVLASGTVDLKTTKGSIGWRLESGDLGELARLIPGGDPAPPAPAGVTAARSTGADPTVGARQRSGQAAVEASGGAGTPVAVASSSAEPSSDPWRPTSGRATAQGTLQISPSGVTTNALFELYDLEAPGISAERGMGSMEISPAGLDALRIELSDNDAALLVTGSIPLSEPLEEDLALRFDLAVDAADWPLDRLARWTPQELPINGRFTGRFRIGGPEDALSGRVDGRVAPADLMGFDVEGLSGDLQFDSETLVVDAARIEVPAGVIEGSGELQLASGALDFALSAPVLDLSLPPFADIVGGDLRGQVEVSSRIEGSLDEPRIEAQLQGTQLLLAGRSLGDDGAASMQLSWADGSIEASGSLLGLTDFSGGGQVGDSGIDLTFQMGELAIDHALKLVTNTPPVGLGGTTTGSISVTAGAGSSDLSVAIELDRLSLRYRDRTMNNLEPVVARWSEAGLQIESFYLGEPGTDSDLFVFGTIVLEEDPVLDLRLQSTVDASWANAVLDGYDLSGETEVLATIAGTVSEPKLNGVGSLSGSRLVVDGFPYSLQEIDAVALLYPNRIVIDSATARFGGGSLRGQGQIQLFGPEAPNYRIEVVGDGISLRYPEGFWIRGDATMTLASTTSGQILSGFVDLDRAYYLEDVDLSLTQLIQGALRKQRLQVRDASEDLAATELALTIRAPSAVRVRNNLADLVGTGDLTLRGTLARPVIFGDIEFERDGKLVFSDTEYEIERARITFANPVRIDPVIDLVASAQVRNYSVQLNLTGRVEDLDASFTSDPPLPDLDIVALLTTGATFEDRRAAASQSEGVGADRFLAGQVGSVISKRVNNLFGLDRFKITPVEGTSGESLAGVGVTIGKRLSQDVLVTFTENPGSVEGQVLQVEWQVDRQLTLVLTGRGNETYSIDARWEKRF